MPRLPKGIYKRTYCTKRGAKSVFYGAIWDCRYKKLYTTRLCHTVADARVLYTELANKIDRGELAPRTKHTVSDFVIAYCDFMQRRVQLGKIKHSTYQTNISIVNSTLGKHYGDLPVHKLTPELMEELLDTLLKESTPNYVREVMMKIRQALDFAVKKRLLAVNPVNAIELPDKTLSDVLQPSLEHVRFILKNSDPRSGAIIGLAALAGLRRGEVFGLTLKSVDLDTSRIHVTQQYHAGRITTPKSRKSIRTVPILPELKNILMIWIDQCDSDKWLFMGKFRPPLKPDTWVNNYLKPLLKQLDLPPYTLHSFRHAFDTMMHNAGFKTRDIMKMMGHGDMKLTLDYDGEDEYTIKRLVEETANVRLFKVVDKITGKSK